MGPFGTPPAPGGINTGNQYLLLSRDRSAARGRPIIVEWERDARHSAGLSLVRRLSEIEAQDMNRCVCLSLSHSLSLALSLSLLGGLTMPEWKGRVPLTRSHCERITWVFGDFLCKMYQFVHSLSYTASIFILVVICTERYFAIIHPITCKQILTSTRLRLVIVGVWITSAAYSAPKFIWVETITNSLSNGQTETICIQHRMKYNSEIFDMVNFGLLYVAPLCVMTTSSAGAVGSPAAQRVARSGAVLTRQLYKVVSTAFLGGYANWYRLLRTDSEDRRRSETGSE
ncbi:Trissin receptor [Eumeta japonica]|uniref:Trissin receptor n=1 Tax=Eumeta variegata TaxID=151549 RepID=A0A4C1XLZ2_EUMVA|nr:Trissin receptor [Eumeta japonica]